MEHAPATPAEGSTLTKPLDWAIHMVAAALKCVTDETALATTADEAKYAILKALNWFEAHDEYEWPDFASLNYSFEQVMRLRRALVSDVYNALEKAGKIKLRAPGTPESTAGTRRRRSSEAGREIKKRSCRPQVSDDAIYEPSDPNEDDEFFDSIVIDLISRSKIDLAKHKASGKDPRFIADLVHDTLVEMWDGPLQEEGEHARSLREKADVWNRHKRSVPPVSSQRERTPNPRTSPAAPQTSPVTVQKHAGGSARPSWDAPGWTAANRNWESTNSIG